MNSEEDDYVSILVVSGVLPYLDTSQTTRVLLTQPAFSDGGDKGPCGSSELSVGCR